MKTGKLKTIIYSILFIISAIGIIQLLSKGSLLILPDNIKWYIFSVVASLLVILLTWFALRIEGNRFKDIGWKWSSKTPHHFLYGFLIGNGICALMIIILVLCTDLSVVASEGNSFFSVFLGGLVFIPMAFLEEIIFRGYPFIKLTKTIGLRITMISMALVFAFYHDMSGNTFLSQLLGPGVWAFVFGLAVITKGGITLATGLHFATNFFQAFFGMKSGYASLWEFEYTSEVTTAMQSKTETIGLILQITLLIITVFLIERHISKKKKLTNNMYIDQNLKTSSSS